VSYKSGPSTILEWYEHHKRVVSIPYWSGLSTIFKCVFL